MAEGGAGDRSAPFYDHSGKFLAGLLLPKNAGANSAVDHINV